MTEVLHSPSHFPSSPNTPSDALFCTQNSNSSSTSLEGGTGIRVSTSSEREIIEEREELKRREKERDELSIIALLVAVFRKSLIACSSTDRGDRLRASNMDIGWPTNVRHVAHVTFDRFDGFLGLPDEFEPEVPRRAPSASTSVFGVSTESMQLTYDSRGNCVPTILILMQRRLYDQGGLQEEGIFRITAENSQEEFVRDQLNRGIVPNDIDVHCLAGLIKAWFRELPSGVLDPLSPEDVMRCESEEDCTELVKELPQTEAALLDWAINLMADVVQEEHYNKMNAHNIAMVFAPNMTQMADPLTALMYAVQVMNFLKTLITKILRDREESGIDPPSASCAGPPDENGHQSPSQPSLEDLLGEDEENTEAESESDPEHYSSDEEPPFDSPFDDHSTQNEDDGDESDDSPFHWHSFGGLPTNLAIRTRSRLGSSDGNGKCGESSGSHDKKVPTEKPKGMSNLSCINTRMEVWR